MSYLPPLVSDLALILIFASIFSVLFKRIKQPVVLGYIIAGLLAGPQIGFIPTVSDIASIDTWADIGVIFLMFALGLDFSFKKLLHVGMTAVIATTTIVVSMIALGYLLGLSMGWSHNNSLFLGSMMCMSSTMIIVKVFDDFGLRNQRFSGIVLGILIIEDLFAVLLMVLLSTVALSKHFEGAEMLGSIFKLLGFLLFWFITGIYLIPTFLKKAKRFLNNETLLVISLGLCFGMVMLATHAGFSSALGAFVMGSILAETTDAEKIEHLVQPVKNLFGAIFFVSVGMMIDIPTIGHYWWPILLISLVVIVGQIIFAFIGVLLSGQALKIALQSCFALPQIGEFSYIIASLGLSLGVIAQFLYPVIVSVSIVTIFLTPYLIKLSGPVYILIEKKAPASWKKYMNKETSGAHPVGEENIWKKLLKEMGKITALYMLTSIMILILSFQYLVPWICGYIEGLQGRIFCTVIILLILAPFLRAIMVKKNHSDEFEFLWNKSKNNRGPLIFTIILRVVISMTLIIIVEIRLLDTKSGMALFLAGIIVLIFLFSKQLKKHSILIERHFKKNLHARRFYEDLHAPINRKFANHLLGMDLHLAEFDIKQHYPVIGKTLQELNFRQRYGVNVVTIIRGEKRINIPGGDEHLYPMDKIIVVGNDKQMLMLQRYIEDRNKNYQNLPQEPVAAVNMEQLRLEKGSPLIGKTIKMSHIRDKYDCLVVGIERDKSSMLNPDIDLELTESDVIWVVGERKKIIELNKLCSIHPLLVLEGQQ